MKMKKEILNQAVNSKIIIENSKNGNIWIKDNEHWVLVKKDSLPELIKILQSFVEIN
jgi:hypothetical protein